MADIPFELDEEGAAVLQPLITARGHGSLVELLNESPCPAAMGAPRRAGRACHAAVDPQTGTGTPYPTFTFTPTAPPAPPTI